MYSVRGRCGATAATADHAVFNVWNGHSTQRIKVTSFQVFANSAPTAGWSLRLRRTSARGTAGSTVTPGISNHSELGVAPPSGVVLDLAAFSAQPTLLSSSVDMGFGYSFAAVVGAGFIYPIPGGITIGPGAGLALIQVAATAGVACDITINWLEDWV